MRRLLFGCAAAVIASAVIASCRSATCSTDADCPAGAYCDFEIRECFVRAPVPPEDAGIEDAGTGDAGTDDSGIGDAGLDAGSEVQICSPDGWCWQEPWPTGATFTAVTELPDGGYFAVGSDSTLIEIGGNGVRGEFGRFGSVAFQSVHHSNDGRIWVSAPGGFIAFHDGNAWNEISVPDAGITDVKGTGGGEAWASAIDGRLWHFRGGQWSSRQLNYWLEGIEVGSNGTWAYGSDINLRVGETWDDQCNLGCSTDCSWSDAWSGPDGTTWFVGEGRNCIVSIKDGVATRHPRSDSGDVRRYAVFGYDNRDVWVLSEDSAEHWDGTQWKLEPSDLPWNASDAVISGDASGLAVGGGGVFWRLTSGKWLKIEEGARKAVWDISLASDGAAWAAANDAQVLRRVGRRWEVFSTGQPNPVRSISALSAEDVWAVGAAGTALHWNGTTWTTFDLQTTENLLAVRAKSHDDVWVLRADGVVVRNNGVTWAPVSVPGASGSIKSLIALQQKSVAVVRSNAVHLWNGSTWKTTFPGFEPYAVCQADTDRVMVLGMGSALLWSPVTDDSEKLTIPFQGLACVSLNDEIYALASTAVWKFSAGGFVRMSGGTAGLSGLASNSDELLAGGASGRILSLRK